MKTAALLVGAVITVATGTTGCRDKPSGTGEEKGVSQSPAAVGRAGPHERVEERKTSDLDQPVDALFARTCEHKRKTFECDQCRYEIGVVKAPRALFDEGLLKTTQVVRERVAQPLLLTGEVRFDERRVTHVSLPAQGVVRKASVTLGDRVKKGQPLVEVESITVGEAEGAYLEAKAALRLAASNYGRQTQLRKESISSEKDYLQARQEYEAAQIRVEAALGKLTRMGVGLGDARQITQGSSHGRLVLRAPVDGMVLTMHAVAGEVAKSEESLVTIGDNSVVWVWADLYERDIARVTRLQAARRLAASVSVKAYPGEEFSGTVDFVSPAMEEASRTVKVRIEIPNQQRRLLAGMFASVKVFLLGDQEAPTLPKGAVLQDDGRSFVFVHHHGDYYVRRPVTPGRTWADRVEIAAGLAGGETVVADGAFLMKSDVLRSKMGAGCAD
jgi:cobalt-zinc-cadmium efflux system membrane fusion protein